MSVLELAIPVWSFNIYTSFGGHRCLHGFTQAPARGHAAMLLPLEEASSKPLAGACVRGRSIAVGTDTGACGDYLSWVKIKLNAALHGR